MKPWQHASRKFQFAALTSVLIFLAGIISGIWTGFAAQLPVVVGGLLASAATYLTGNVIESKATIAATGKVPPATDPAPATKPVPSKK